jgi:hypothetical protein
MILELIPGALLIIFIYSYIVKDNVLFRFAESTFVGYAVAHIVVLVVQTLKGSVAEPLGAGNFIPLVAVILGVLLLTRISPRIRYLSRWPIALIVAASSALFARGLIDSDIIGQIIGTIGSGFQGSALDIFNRVVVVVGVVSALVYFVFTERRTRGSKSFAPTMRYLRTLGKYFLLIGFGVGYGLTFLTRMSLLFGRFVDILRAFGIIP